MSQGLGLEQVPHRLADVQFLELHQEAGADVVLFIIQNKIISTI